MLVYWASVKYFLSLVKLYKVGLQLFFFVNDMNNFTACVQKFHAFQEIIHELKT